MANKLVEMRSIDKRFGAVHALRDVDFNMEDRESVGLVGDNGAGKSTLIKILTGVLEKDGGEIYYKGKKAEFDSPREARERGIETVYQEQALAPDLSVRRNIFMGREPTKGWGPFQFLDHDKMEKESEKVMSELDMKVDSMNQQVQYCSGGEQEGIAISRAMYFEADLVILDEPTRALGVGAIKTVLNLVEELHDRGIAIIYISHNLERVYKIVDRIVALVQGEVKVDVPKEETSVDEITDTLLRL